MRAVPDQYRMGDRPDPLKKRPGRRKQNDETVCGEPADRGTDSGAEEGYNNELFVEGE